MCATVSVFLLNVSQFHKTFPKSSSQMHWISVRFYEMGDIRKQCNAFQEQIWHLNRNIIFQNLKFGKLNEAWICFKTRIILKVIGVYDY